MMKKTNHSAVIRANETVRSKRGNVVAMMLCAVLAVPPVWGADPATNEANLNFVGADIESVVRAVGHYTNTTFIIDPRVKGTITLVSEKPVSKEEAFSMLTSVLRLQGYTVVRNDGFAKVVPEADAKLQAGPIQAGKVRGDQIATQIFRLNYESAQNLVAVLRPLISPNNTINANPGTNSLVITDYADNLKRLSKIIDALDNPATKDFDVIPIENGIASDIAVMVNRLMEGSNAPGAVDTGRTVLMADSRSNSVIIRAPSAARANLARSLVAKLDKPTSQPGNVHIVYLKNADATKLAQTLRAVVSGDTSTAAQGAQGNQSPTNRPGATAGNQALGGGGQTAGGLTLSSSPGGTQSGNATSATQGLPAGGPAGFIQADVATNTLIITASEPVYRNLRTVIDQLDVRRAQVYVESLIVEVSADKAAQLGIQWLGVSGDSGSRYRVGAGTAFAGGGDNLFQQAAGIAANGVPALPGNGLTLGVVRQIGGQLGLGALARALETDANANILSVPNLMTLDNEEAKIIVGQNVPFITGQYTTAASGGGAGVNPFQTIERKDIGLALSVRPQISEGGTVKMAIYQEVSSIRDASNVAGIITNKRSIESNVLVDDGQTIVLGGLIDDNASNRVEKVPGLGDLPLVGGLFRYQNRSRNKTNLMVFLRPIIIRSSDQSVNVVTDRYEYMRNAEAGAQVPPSAVLPNFGSPALPPLQDGRLVGGGSFTNNAPQSPDARQQLQQSPYLPNPGQPPQQPQQQPQQPQQQPQQPQQPQPLPQLQQTPLQPMRTETNRMVGPEAM